MTEAPATINGVQLTMLMHALALEVKHPRLKAHSRLNTLATAKRMGYAGKNRKVHALAWAAEIVINNNLPLSPSVVEALELGGYEVPEEVKGKKVAV